MAGKAKKQSRNTEDQNTAKSSENDSSGSPRIPNVLFFLFVGLILVLGLSGLHLLFCGVISYTLGLDFMTVIYVTSASVVTGGVILMATSLLASLYFILTFYAGMRSIASARRTSRASTATADIISGMKSSASSSSKND